MKMLPSLSLDNRIYIRGGCAVLFCDFLHTLFTGSNGDNLTLRKFSLKQACQSAFLGRINHVIRSRANKKMFRVYAKAVVARMTDVKAVRDFTNMKLIAEPMRSRRTEGSPPALNHAVSVGFSCAVPYPTPILVDGNISSEAIYEGSFNSWHGTSIHRMGNTGPGNEGSQRDGQGMYRRVRTVLFWDCGIRGD